VVDSIKLQYPPRQYLANVTIMTSNPKFNNKTTATEVGKAYADLVKGKTGMRT
jgi:hypothetical protein